MGVTLLVLSSTLLIDISLSFILFYVCTQCAHIHALRVNRNIEH